MVLQEMFEFSIDLSCDVIAKYLAKLDHVKIWPNSETKVAEDKHEVTIRLKDKELVLKVGMKAIESGKRRVIRFEGEGGLGLLTGLGTMVSTRLFRYSVGETLRFMVEYVVEPSGDESTKVRGSVLLISDPLIEESLAEELAKYAKMLQEALKKDLELLKSEMSAMTATPLLKHMVSSNVVFVGYGRQRANIMRFFERDLGFDPIKTPELGRGFKVAYEHPKRKYVVDIHFGRVVLKDHDVEFDRGRFRHDFPTAPLAELLLERLQYRNPSYEVLVDALVLLLAHDVCEKDREECINGKQIAKHLSNDWEYWRDVTSNLSKVRDLAEALRSKGVLSKEQRDRIVERVNKLLKIIEKEPKSRAWVKRDLYEREKREAGKK